MPVNAFNYIKVLSFLNVFSCICKGMHRSKNKLCTLPYQLVKLTPKNN